MSEPTARQIEVLKIVAEWAQRFSCIQTVYVFGSFARGVQKPSDIDIAVGYVEDVAKRPMLECYSNVNACSAELEQSLSKVVSAPVGWTGLVIAQGYDQTAWAAIRAGRMLRCCGKAQLIWTD